jgi:hypothetical protein
MLLHFATEEKTGWRSDATKSLKEKYKPSSPEEEIRPDIFTDESFRITAVKILRLCLKSTEDFIDSYLDRHFAAFCAYYLFGVCWFCG